MENLTTEAGEMAGSAEGNSESSRLVAQNATASKPSYINVFSNLCALIFLGIIMYCCFKDGVNLFSFHPSLMTLGNLVCHRYVFMSTLCPHKKVLIMLIGLFYTMWLLVMTTAVNAITPGDLATEWMPIRLRSARHWVLQLVAGIVILTGFLIILSNKIIHDKSHFVTLHAKFGLAAFIFMLMTMLGGLGALYSLKLKYYLAPIYTKLIHASVGLVTYVLGVIAILLGLFSVWWVFGETLRYTAFTLVLVIMLCTILRPSLKIYFRLKERIENSN